MTVLKEQLEIVNRRNFGRSTQLTKRMDRMNLAEVQLVANDFLSQIEGKPSLMDVFLWHVVYILKRGQVNE